MNQGFQKYLDNENNRRKEFFTQAIQEGFTDGQVGGGTWVGSKKALYVLTAIKDSGEIKISCIWKSQEDGGNLTGLPIQEKFTSEKFEIWKKEWKVTLTNPDPISEILESFPN